MKKWNFLHDNDRKSFFQEKSSTKSQVSEESAILCILCTLFWRWVRSGMEWRRSKSKKLFILMICVSSIFGNCMHAHAHIFKIASILKAFFESWCYFCVCSMLKKLMNERVHNWHVVYTICICYAYLKKNVEKGNKWK